MIALVGRRLLQMPFVLLVIYTITLTLAWLVPGNPLDNPEGRRPPDEVVAAMQAQYNLDSFPKFYLSYLRSATGIAWVSDHFSGESARRVEKAAETGIALPPAHVFDLGPSLQYRDRRVNELIADFLPVSMEIGALAMIIATTLGVAIGVAGAARPGSIWDSSSLLVALIGISIPSFILGTLLLLVFGVWLAWVPVGGWGTLKHLILPALTLSLPFTAYIARLTRMGMLEALSADYIRTARAKGACESSILLRHALKNAFLPVLSYLGPATAYAMTGSFVVERVFNVPGLGQHFVHAVQNKDLFVIIGIVLVFSAMLVLFNLAVDVMYRWIDPRIQ